MKPPDFWLTGRGPWPRLLAPLGALYRLGGTLRRGLARPRRAAVPVICVGNLTAGGTGKTPIAIALAARLARRGLRPHILCRGYGGSLAGPVAVDPVLHDAAAVGDEALLLARAAPCWVARERAAGAEAAALAGADVLILDDGFQDPALVQDLGVIVVDGETGFGNGRTIPAGPLREGLAGGLARADAVLIMGDDAAHVAATVARHAPGLAVLRCRLVPAGDTGAFRGACVFAFAGIGRPEKFRATLEQIGAEVAGFRAFPDHHVFTAGEIARLRADADGARARLVTTAKDFVRLRPNDRVGIDVIDIIAELDGAIDDLLARVIAAAAPSRPSSPRASAAPEAPDRAG